MRAVKFRRTAFHEKYLNICQDSQIALGFTEKNFELNDLTKIFRTEDLIELKQVHADTIHFSKEIEPGSAGDGIILEQRNRLAVIKTADCVPLFFWDNTLTIAGIIHVGWQGLLRGIEQKLLILLKKRSISLENLYFFLGPSIERDCYQVGKDLYDKFSRKTYRQDLFLKLLQDKYLMDIKKGILLSLKSSGIREDQIMLSDLCTFCEKERFPSYRRDHKTGQRIYNFLYLK